MRPHALRADLFGGLDRETERVPVERERLVDVLNGDADVIEDGAVDCVAVCRAQISVGGPATRRS